MIRGESIEGNLAQNPIATRAEAKSERFQTQTLAVRSVIHKAAAALTRLHASSERANWSVAENGILELLGQPKLFDDQVARQPNGLEMNASPKVGSVK